MQPSMRMHIAMRAPHPTASLVSKSGTLAAKKALFPTIVWLGSAYLVGLYVSKQLHQKSVTFDDIFAQQNTPEVEEARKKDLLVETYGDPRNSLLNVLGWTK
ncbi:hypothetical protein GGS24DRAFT_439230 [Hypoxylon argillaceum]|nr:hypothetical protein GGS24DRAFT_439230 [Hypoxylon argillaceum]KAI1157095.1 hypothetical protein F4825DRAFT_400601 [Nemania diffusa]